MTIDHSNFKSGNPCRQSTGGSGCTVTCDDGYYNAQQDGTMEQVRIVFNADFLHGRKISIPREVLTC